MALVFCAVSTQPLAGWGADVHRMITARAIDGVPPVLQRWLVAERSFVVEHSLDPDLWRILGLSGALGPEGPNHFFNIDAFDERAPFRAVPRDRAALVRRYGARRANEAGRLPWQTADIYRRLVEALTAAGRGASGAAQNARFLAAVLAHYVEDAHVPFHAVRNHDGQLTGQAGIHARFETEAVRRGLPTFTLAPVRVVAVPDVVEFSFQALVESESLASAVLEADRSAALRDPRYSDRYYAAFVPAVRAVLERRLSESASAVASLWVAAWQQAGSPALAPSGRGGPGSAAGR
jgi:hypothetical protein